MADNRNNRYNNSRGNANSGRQARRQSGRVPPLDAFDNVPKRRPPNLPGSPDFDPHADATGRPKNVSRGSGNTLRMPVVNTGTQQGRAKNGGAAGGNSRTGRRQGGRANGAAHNGGQPRGGAQNTRQGKNNGGKGRNSKNGKRKNGKPKKRLTRKQRIRRNWLIAFFSVLAIVVAGVWFSFAVLFKIDGFVIDGTSPYTEAEIIASFGKQPEENMFSYRAGESARRMEHELPYLASVKITRKLPGTVVITVVEAKECYTLQWDGGYLVLGEAPGLKVLRTAEQAPEGLTELYGLSDLVAETGYGLQLATLEKDEEYDLWQQLAQPPVSSYEQPAAPPDPTPQDEGEGAEGEEESPAGEGAGGEGQTADGENPEGAGTEGENGEGGTDEGQTEPEQAEPEQPEETGPPQLELAPPTQRLEVLVQLLGLLDDNELTGVEWINVTDTLDVQFRWQGRVTVKLGAPSSMAENLTAALVIMRQQLSSSDYGTLDVSTYTSTLQSVFSPETPPPTAPEPDSPPENTDPVDGQEADAGEGGDGQQDSQNGEGGTPEGQGADDAA